MAPLIICYSHTRKTMALCRKLQNTIPGTKLAEIKETAPLGKVGAYTKGLMQVFKNKLPDITLAGGNPGEHDVLVAAGPVWASNPAPALKRWLLDTDLSGKKLMVVLTAQKSADEAAATIPGLLEGKGLVALEVRGLCMGKLDEAGSTPIDVTPISEWLYAQTGEQC